jgi:hypothetical protein
MHFNHIEIMLIHQKYEIPGRGVDVDGPGSEAVGTGEADHGLRYCIIPCQFLFLSIHFLVRRKDSTAQNRITAKFSRI